MMSESLGRGLMPQPSGSNPQPVLQHQQQNRTAQQVASHARGESTPTQPHSSWGNATAHSHVGVFPGPGGFSLGYMPNVQHSAPVSAEFGAGHPGAVIRVPEHAAMAAAQQLRPPTVIVTQQGSVPIAMTGAGSLTGQQLPLPVAAVDSGPQLSHAQMVQQMQHLKYLQQQQIQQRQQQQRQQHQQGPTPQKPSLENRQSDAALPAAQQLKAKVARPAQKAALGGVPVNGAPSGLAPAMMEIMHKQQKENISLLEMAKRSLPVAYRDDGPPLGFEFDDVPGSSPTFHIHTNVPCTITHPYDINLPTGGGCIQTADFRRFWSCIVL